MTGKLQLWLHMIYLELRDREVLLASSSPETGVAHSGQPGALLRDGAVIGSWRMRTQAERIQITLTLFEAISAKERQRFCEEAEKLAAFLGRSLTDLQIHT
ncbi:MAG: DNA glycosylase AlkZ-like family protein [Merdibacter sp.]